MAAQTGLLPTPPTPVQITKGLSLWLDEKRGSRHPTHHTLIDRKENETVYTVEILHAMKAEHEARVLERLDQDPMPTKQDIALAVLPLLEENRQSWAQYGPLSELARTQPHNESAHAVWMSERLSVIVPNNRKIAVQIEEHRSLFDAGEQGVVTAFLLHVRSYEQWVEDAIPYAAVKRFPVEFDDLIRLRTHNQKSTVAARAMADRKTVGHRS